MPTEATKQMIRNSLARGTSVMFEGRVYERMDALPVDLLDEATLDQKDIEKRTRETQAKLDTFLAKMSGLQEKFQRKEESFDAHEGHNPLLRFVTGKTTGNGAHGKNDVDDLMEESDSSINSNGNGRDLELEIREKQERLTWLRNEQQKVEESLRRYERAAYPNHS